MAVKKLRPVHPGDILRQDFMEPLKLSSYKLAKGLGVSRKDRIPLNRVGAVWSMLRKQAATAPRDHERTACDWLSLVLLTGLRRTESGAIRKSDLDVTLKVIRLRGDVDGTEDGFAGVKNHNDMTLPMSTVLHDILASRVSATPDESAAARRRKRDRATDYVFPSFGRKRPYISSAPALLREISEIAGCTISLHSLRRTADDIAKCVKVDSDERRQLLNHLASDVHGHSYTNNPDPEVLRPAVEAIAQYVINAAKLAGEWSKHCAVSDQDRLTLCSWPAKFENGGISDAKPCGTRLVLSENRAISTTGYPGAAPCH